MTEYLILIFIAGQFQVVQLPSKDGFGTPVMSKEQCEFIVRGTKALVQEFNPAEMVPMFCVPKEEWLAARK